MTPEQIRLVQSTFDQVKPDASRVAGLFYNRLFTLDPALRALFKGDLAQQGSLLMTMLSSAVNGLARLETVVPLVHKLGARHLQYGVREEHYATVGSALLWTLEQGLGEKFTLHVSEAWTLAYEVLSGAMLQGAAEAGAERALGAVPRPAGA